MRAAWPVWNNDNPLPGKPPRAWIPVVIQNSGHPVPAIDAPDSSFLNSHATPRARWLLLGPFASIVAHAALLAAGILLSLPVDDSMNSEGSAVEVEIISMQTVTSNEVSEALSDASQSMLAAGAEAVESVESETVDPVTAETTRPTETIEPVEPDAAEPVETSGEVAPVEPTPVQEAVAEPTEIEPQELLVAEAVLPEPTETVQPVTAEPVEAESPTEPAAETVEAVDPDAPPAPRVRTVAQRKEPTYPEKPPEPKKAQPQPPKAKPVPAGSGGNAQASTAAGAPSTGKQGNGAQGSGNAFAQYSGKVRAKLARVLRNAGGASGAKDALVEFQVAANGSVSGIRLVGSSGNAAFDKVALDTVRRAAPFAPIPADAGVPSWVFTMPLGTRR